MADVESQLYTMIKNVSSSVPGTAVENVSGKTECTGCPQTRNPSSEGGHATNANEARNRNDCVENEKGERVSTLTTGEVDENAMVEERWKTVEAVASEMWLKEADDIMDESLGRHTFGRERMDVDNKEDNDFSSLGSRKRFPFGGNW
jgi:hypothetical protein